MAVIRLPGAVNAAQVRVALLGLNGEKIRPFIQYRRTFVADAKMDVVELWSGPVPRISCGRCSA